MTSSPRRGAPASDVAPRTHPHSKHCAPCAEAALDLRQPVQHFRALLREIHPHHAVVIHIALPADQAISLQRLRRAGHARRIQLVLLGELTLAQPIAPVQHREQEPLHAPDPRLPLYRRQHPLESQRERREHRMNAPQNLFLAVPFYHHPTSVCRVTLGSLRPIFAVSTFASESVVMVFTWSSGEPRLCELVCATREIFEFSAWFSAKSGSA